MTVAIKKKKNMVLSFGDGVTFVVVLHQVWKKHPVHQDFLGFYVVDSHRMSMETQGLLGKERKASWKKKPVPGFCWEHSIQPSQ